MNHIWHKKDNIEINKFTEFEHVWVKANIITGIKKNKKTGILKSQK